MATSADPYALEHWFTLMLVPGIGPASANKLLRAFGSPLAVLSAGADRLRGAIPEALVDALIQSPSSHQVAAQRQLDFAQNHAHTLRVFTLADPDYPVALLEAPNPPPVLWAWGNTDLLTRPALAIVGSRSATQAGTLNAKHFAERLGAAGLCIVSGLALGIDAAAHTGALASRGGTIAVLGCGVDQVYPRRNQALYQAIAQDGLLVSEQAPGCTARPAHFPQRNRLIAALSNATLVVEAARDSGSLITAKLASEIGRDVMAIPGSIHSPHSKGCHWLIKQGAKLVESADDVLEELPSHLLEQLTKSDKAFATRLSAAPHFLLAHIGFEPTSLESIALSCALTAQQVQSELLGLELAEQIERLADGRYQRLPGN